MRCGDCGFYSPIPTSDDTGECRESPPKVFMVPVRGMAGDGIGFQAIFPQVHQSVWCGAFDVEGFGDGTGGEGLLPLIDG